MMKYYAIAGRSTCVTDETANPICPTEHIEMQGPRPTPEHVAQADGTWALPTETLEGAKAAKLTEIAAARFEAETGGTVVNNIGVDTSRESQALITGAALQATIDPSYTCQWKTAEGFVQLTAEMILGVAVAVRQHVQACFDREATLTGQVEAAGTVAEVEAISW